jgi:hypothetical protein
MTVAAKLLPVFVQVALTLSLLFLLAWRRYGAVQRGEVRLEPEFALRSDRWPPRVRQASNALANQSEIPVLFYAAMVLGLVVNAIDFPFVVVAWVFVIARLLHAGVYVTSNDIRFRFPTFAVSVLAVIVLWVMIALHVFLAPPLA